MRKILATGFLSMSLLLSLTPSVHASSPPLQARAAALIDAHTGQVLYELHGQETQFPASTTKLLTALVAVEHGNPGDSITVSQEAVTKPYDSSMCHLTAEEQQPLEYLLYGLLLVSGNDCAQAVAEGVAGGSEKRFVDLMNETARDLGATHSHFTNSHGLHDPDHYTTALDLAAIGRKALQNQTILRIAGAKEFHWPGKTEINGVYYNHNAMLFTYEGVVGGKNGYTEEAGNTLVIRADKYGRSLIGVLLGEVSSSQLYEDMAALLDYGFDEFESVTLVEANVPIGEVPVQYGRVDKVPVSIASNYTVQHLKGSPVDITVRPKYANRIVAPINAGQELGKLEIYQGDRVLETIPLVAQNDVPASLLTLSGLINTAGPGLKWLLYLSAVVLLMYAAVRSVVRTHRTSHR